MIQHTHTKNQPSLSARRAWIEILFSLPETLNFTSLSARRAWIEIRRALGFVDPDKVALRKESVDRNRLVVGSLITLGGSLSARRAWIEIVEFHLYASSGVGRSPQGERG